LLLHESLAVPYTAGCLPGTGWLQDETWQKLQMVATLCNNSRFVVTDPDDDSKAPLNLVRVLGLSSLWPDYAWDYPLQCSWLASLLRSCAINGAESIVTQADLHVTFVFAPAGEGEGEP
jgi:hypothetical protein